MPSIIREHIFEIFKYSIYFLLAINIFIFFQEEWLATDHTFAGGISFREIIEGFSATIDTAAWVILLLLFELETYVLPDEKIKGKVKPQGYSIIRSTIGDDTEDDLLALANSSTSACEVLAKLDEHYFEEDEKRVDELDALFEAGRAKISRSWGSIGDRTTHGVCC